MLLIFIFNLFLLVKSDILDQINADLNSISAKIASIERDHVYLKTEDEQNLLNNTERYREFVKYYSASECVHSKPNRATTYVKRHIMNSLLLNSTVPDTHWDEYKLVFNKSYLSSHHESGARAAWRDNLGLVAAHNRAYLAGHHDYTLHLNRFADLSLSNFMKKMLKLIDGSVRDDPAHDPTRAAFHNTRHTGIPDKVDWRERGFKPRLENQYHCGACYAFTIAHALQAQLFRIKRDARELSLQSGVNTLATLLPAPAATQRLQLAGTGLYARLHSDGSVQQVVDCSRADGNQGCNGGALPYTLRYAARAGLELETDYPYVGRVGKCKYSAVGVRARAARWAQLPRGDEAAMARALADIGPLAIAVNALPRTFSLYKSGVYDDPQCASKPTNHAMLLVGYTPTYWILLNWWGPTWGEGGYMRMRRGVNRCGIANEATYVELV